MKDSPVRELCAAKTMPHAVKKSSLQNSIKLRRPAGPLLQIVTLQN
jgi:hypothetical protein